MLDGELSPKIIKMILCEESDFRRFEEFCCALYSAHDGRTYLPTSRSHDRARDGRTSTLDPRERGYYVCVSTQDRGQKTKAISDLKELVRHSTARGVRFCFSDEIGEDLRDTIIKDAKQIVPNCEFEVDGLSQIVPLAKQFRRQFLAAYMPDLHELQDFLKQELSTEIDKAPSLRLALATSLSGNLKTVRNQVACSLILTALKNRADRTDEEIAHWISHQLGLRRPVGVASLIHPIKVLLDEKRISRTVRGLQITEIGVAELTNKDTRSAGSFLSGRKIIRAALETHMGWAFSAGEFTLVWRAIREELALMFLHNGMNLVRDVAGLAGDHASEPRQAGLRDHLQQLAARIRRINFQYAEFEDSGRISARISAAIYDVFDSPTSAAFQWMTDLCVVYVVICSLGLEPGIQERVSERIKSWIVLLDTDNLVSCVATADNEHKYTTSVLRGWHDVGGRLRAPSPALRETAHHISIAKKQYQKWYDGFMSARKFDPLHSPFERFDENVNVVLRSFVMQFSSDPNPRKFAAYITNFLGPRGDEKILSRWLMNKFAIEELDDAHLDDGDVQTVVAELTPIWKSQGYYSTETFDALVSRRCECDARLICLLLGLRKKLASGENPVLVSRSTGLRSALERIQAKNNDVRTAVVPLTSLAFALAMVPGSHVSVRSLRQSLFTGVIARHLPAGAHLKEMAFDAVSDDAFEAMEEPQLAENVDDALGQG